MYSIGEIISTYRKKKGLLQQDLADELAKEGIAIIMVSSELPEIINMCDNVCVIRAGKLVGKLGKDQMNQEEIMKYAAGGVE
jgi:ribose transport system ATP-binding protein